jgi:hypothetical protein
MKYLVLGRRKDAFLMLPPEKRVEIWEGMVAFIEKYRKAGKCKEIYYDADLKGSMSIWETDSEEESTKFITENPFSPFSDMDIRPVIGWDIGVKATREVFQQLTKK